MLKRLLCLSLICACFPVIVNAQEKPWLLRTLKAVESYMDSSAIKGVDTRYIAIPKYPWQLMVRHNINQMSLKMHSYFSDLPDGGELFLDTHLKSNVANNVGLWIGYRGYGVGYSVGFGPKGGTYFTAGFTGNSYALNMRLRTFKATDVQAHIYGHDVAGFSEDGNPSFDKWEDVEMDAPIRVRTLIVDGYYFFNRKRFSYMAAYDQSAIQIHSAGSIMVGAMYHSSTIRYDDNVNASFIFLMHEVGVLKIRQGSVGAGYAYNWVPGRGFLVSIQAMPMLTFYNRQKLHIYEETITDDDHSYNDKITAAGTIYKTSNMTVTFNARMSLTYNWNRLSFNVYGQWNHFRYNHDTGGRGHINDWFVNSSVGFRF